MMGFIWFWLVAVMIVGYVVLDGFDLGVGILHLFLPRTEGERRAGVPSCQACGRAALFVRTGPGHPGPALTPLARDGYSVVLRSTWSGRSACPMAAAPASRAGQVGGRAGPATFGKVPRSRPHGVQGRDTPDLGGGRSVQPTAPTGTSTDRSSTT